MKKTEGDFFSAESINKQLLIETLERAFHIINYDNERTENAQDILLQIRLKQKLDALKGE